MNFQNNGFNQNNYQKMFELFVQFMNNQNMNMNMNNNNFNNFCGNNNFNNFNNFGGNNNFMNNNMNNFMNNNMNNFNMNNCNMNNFMNNNMNNFNMNNFMNNFNMNNNNFNNNNINMNNFMNFMNNNMNNFNMNNNMNNFNMNNNMNNFNMNNNTNNNVNNNMNNNVNTNNSNSQEQEKPPIIKRSDEFITYETDSGIDIRPILLIASSGLKVLIKISKNKTLKDLFTTYARKIGIGENVLGTKIVFLFNAETIDVNSNKKIQELFPQNSMYSVTVVDQNNVIGAK